MHIPISGSVIRPLNYVLEGGNNFNNELMIALCEKDNNKKLCLISNQPLTDDFIKLKCNHAFNYKPLFMEIVKQKKTDNRLEIQKLNKYQLKCPYCRKVQNNVLPYNEKYSSQHIMGVNWLPGQSLYTNKCESILKSGKRKGEKCNKPSLKKHCKIHKNILIKTKCAALFKSGKNKGKHCFYTAKHNGMCGIHKS